MPGTPSFQPGMTGTQSPLDDWVLRRIAHSESRPGWRLVSNMVPLLSQPVYWTLTVAPGGTVGPVPARRSTNWSPSGNLTGVLLSPSWKSSAPACGVGVVSVTPATAPVVGFGSE